MNLNKHFSKQFDSSNCSLLPNDLKESVKSDYELMSSLGIDNDADQNIFFLLKNHVPEILRNIFRARFNDKTVNAITSEVFRNREKFPVGTLLGLIEAIDLALKKMIPSNLRPKIAYPQPGAIQQRPQYDISRWVSATREIYGLMTKGYDQSQAKAAVIGNWEPREKMDYEQWLKFYKEKVPEKYPKLAFDEGLYVGGLPVEVLRAKMHMNKGKFPNPISGGEGNAQKQPPGLPQFPSEGDNDSVRDKIEGQRKKLISRLNAAEKMLASMDGQLFAGDDQELMLKLLQDLKRRIQTTNKRTAKSTLFEDHIYRTANKLKHSGKTAAAEFFYKIAQLPGMPDLGIGGPPEPMSPPSSGGSGGGSKQDTHDLLQEFFDNITRGVSDKDDTPEKREEQEKKEEHTASVLQPERLKLGNGFWTFDLTKSAQLPAPTEPAEPIENVVPTQTTEEQPKDNTDDAIEAALKHITVTDVIKRLEMLVSVYSQREMSRQLAILDIMMDRLGIASYFPQLGEAMSKELDGNQYIGTRLEETLNKIKGSVEVPGASKLTEPSPVVNRPDTAGLRQRLEQQEADEIKRKEMRKQKELAQQPQNPSAMPKGPENSAAAAPVGEAVELQRPARIEKAPPIKTR